MELGAEKEYVGISAIYQFLGNGVQVVSGSLFYIFAARIHPYIISMSDRSMYARVSAPK